MPASRPRPKTTDGELFELARSFFGFGEEPDRIDIILPGVPRQRENTLPDHENYPPFDFEVAPDDMLSASVVYSLLTRCYGMERVDLRFDQPTTAWSKNRVLIGGPGRHTNVYFATAHFPVHFGDDAQDRLIETPKREHRIHSSKLGGKAFLIEDYCLITRYRTADGTHVVIGGLRAYGQAASYHFLQSEEFYRDAAQKYGDADSFQLLVSVPVYGTQFDHGHVIPFSLPVNTLPRRVRRVFVSYVEENWDKVLRLSQELEQARFDVWLDKRELSPPHSWSAEIERAIEECDCFLACFSREYGARPTFMDQELEWMAERSQRKGEKDRLIPVRLSACKFPAHLKLSASGNGGRREAKRLGDIQWIDLFPEGKRWKEGVRAIKKAIETISLEAAPAEKARGNRHR